MAPRQPLRGGLDRDVYQIVRKLEDQEPAENPRFTVSEVYDTIKRSNSSLSRQKKRPLEDSIERVLRFRKDERREAEGDDEELVLEQASQDAPQPSVCATAYFPLSTG